MKYEYSFETQKLSPYMGPVGCNQLGFTTSPSGEVSFVSREGRNLYSLRNASYFLEEINDAIAFYEKVEATLVQLDTRSFTQSFVTRQEFSVQEDGFSQPIQREIEVNITIDGADVTIGIGSESYSFTKNRVRNHYRLWEALNPRDQWWHARS